MLRVIKPGLQTTLQGAARVGRRHLGVPYAGPADAVSMALANRLVGNAPHATALEVSYGGFEAECAEDCALAITGAAGGLMVRGRAARLHETLHLTAGDRLAILPPRQGVRAYLAIAGGFRAQTHFGSTSTYCPAALGGLAGRVLRAGDEIAFSASARFGETLATPDDLRLQFTNAFALRACPSAETDLLTASARARLFGGAFQAGRQGNRMGVALEGRALELKSDGLMKSVAVYPGVVQCPPSGTPVALLCDAQTTGGYPRIAHVARCDRHLLGQIRPGDAVTLLQRSHAAATADYVKKSVFLKSWLKGPSL